MAATAFATSAAVATAGCTSSNEPPDSTGNNTVTDTPAPPADLPRITSIEETGEVPGVVEINTVDVTVNDSRSRVYVNFAYTTRKCFHLEATARFLDGNGELLLEDMVTSRNQNAFNWEQQIRDDVYFYGPDYDRVETIELTFGGRVRPIC